jgi:hypothetical protein
MQEAAVTYEMRHEKTPFGARVTIAAGGGCEMFEVGMDRHGGLHIHPLDRDKELEPHMRPLGYLYSDELAAVLEAIALLQKDHDAVKAEEERQRMEEQRTCRAKVFSGCSVDLSQAEVFEALDGIEVRLVGDRPEVKYKGQWVRFGRTDLFDDVETIRCCATQEEAEYSVERLRNYNYGARLSDGFFVVDSMTDG